MPSYTLVRDVEQGMFNFNVHDSGFHIDFAGNNNCERTMELKIQIANTREEGMDWNEYAVYEVIHNHYEMATIGIHAILIAFTSHNNANPIFIGVKARPSTIYPTLRNCERTIRVTDDDGTASTLDAHRLSVPNIDCHTITAEEYNVKLKRSEPMLQMSKIQSGRRLVIRKFVREILEINKGDIVEVKFLQVSGVSAGNHQVFQGKVQKEGRVIIPKHFSIENMAWCEIAKIYKMGEKIYGRIVPETSTSTSSGISTSAGLGCLFG